MRTLIAIAALIVPVIANAQRGSKDIVLEAHHIGPTSPLKIYGVAGSVRLVGWDHDSVVITAPSRPLGFYFARDPASVKLGMDQYRFGIEEARTDSTARPFHFVVYLPKQSRISVKTMSADIDGTDVTGWFYSASGSIQLRGTSADLDVETINGSIDVNTNASVVRARTGRGRLIVRGAVQDVDASTVDGELDVATPAIMRGRFASVSGDIRYAGTPALGSIFEFSNHSGAVDLALPREASAALDLSSVTGTVETTLGQARPTAGGAHSLRLTLGHGDAQMTVRTFKGTVRLRPSQP
jgi:DUF4097 and DUF4098 domain-containing protein YvlB